MKYIFVITKKNIYLSLIKALTPKRHETRKCNGKIIIEQVTDFRVNACVRQQPIVALSIALRTHHDGDARFADVLTDGNINN